MRLSIGLIILLVLSVLIYFGVAQRVLDRLRLSDRTALAVIAALIIGGLINIPLPRRPNLEASLNVGGAVVPLILSGYLLVKAGTRKEKLRALAATAVTALAVYLAGRWLSAEPESMSIDPMYIYPLVAGGVAYLSGRSRRSAFIAATVGMILVDLGTYLWLLSNGLPGAVLIGGGGAFDAVITSGLLAVMLAEVVGESREWLRGGPSGRRAPALLKHLRPPQKKDEEGDEDRS